MSSASSALRFRLGVVITLCLVLVLGSFWVLQVQRKHAEDETLDIPRIAPDYYVHKFTFVKMARSRATRYNISGDVLVHNPQDDSYEITHPIINQFANGRPPTLMHSDRALVNSDNSEVQLIGNVDVDRPPSPAIEHFHLKAPALTLLPDDDIMKTDTPVELVLGSSTLNGIGMLANNTTRQLDLSSRVHGVYRPPKPQ